MRFKPLMPAKPLRRIEIKPEIGEKQNAPQKEKSKKKKVYSPEKHNESER